MKVMVTDSANVCKRFHKNRSKPVVVFVVGVLLFVLPLSAAALGVGENKVLEKVSSKVLNTFFHEC